MGTVWATPSPISRTIPVVRPEAYRESTAWMATYMAGTLKVSNMIWVIFSRLALGLRGASVRRRSEERRVGKECVSTCRSRWSQYRYIKKTEDQLKDSDT